MLTLVVRNVDTEMQGPLDPFIANKISTACSYFILGSEYSKLYKDGVWDGTKKLFCQKTKTFPTGIIHKVLEVLDTSAVPYEVIDARNIPKLAPMKLIPPGPEREYQTRCIDLAVQRSRGEIKAATGSGKSFIIAGIIAKTGVKTLVLTHTTTVFTQMKAELSRFLNVPIGSIGGGECNIQHITVGLVQSFNDTIHIYDKKKLDKKGNPKKLRSYQKVKDKLVNYIESLESIIIDEGHHIACETVQTISKVAKHAYYRFSLSATPWRDDGNDILLTTVSGKRFIDISASELIQKGFLAKPTIYMVECKHQRQPAKLTYKDLYTQEIVQNEHRNDLICRIAKTHIEKDDSVLISFIRKEHGKLLYQKLQPIFGDKVRWVDGDSDAEHLQQTLKDLDDKKILCVVGSGVYKEGVDVKSLQVLINATASDSTVNAFQLVGRVLRTTKNKKNVVVYDIKDTGCRWLSQHAVSRETIYKTEPEYVIQYRQGV